MLAAVSHNLCTKLTRPGPVVRVEAPAGMLVHLRPGAARRAITNLMDNARPHAARVQLDASQTERAVLVTVDDDGPGIPPDRRESVFRPFESDSTGGSGLGLTMARDIVRAHGGDHKFLAHARERHTINRINALLPWRPATAQDGSTSVHKGFHAQCAGSLPTISMQATTWRGTTRLLSF